MTLGPALWSNVKTFYDQVSLREHGDPTEQHAASAHSLDTRFPEYERFWRYHVCPATNRPHGIEFLGGTTDIVSLVAQRSYTIFVYVTEAVEFLAEITADNLGPRYRNCYITLMYAGNALQVFTELQCAMFGNPQPLRGVRDLAAQLNIHLDPFPDWRAHWGPKRDKIVNYRNYLTHQGWFYVVRRGPNQIPYVLKRQHVVATPFTWTQADRDYDSDSSRWMKLTDACAEIVNETLAWLNDAYSRVRSNLDPQLTAAAYQRLWGWRDDQPIPPLVARPTPGVSPGASTESSQKPTKPLAGQSWLSLTASTASKVDSNPITLIGEQPPGSGERVNSD